MPLQLAAVVAVVIMVQVAEQVEFLGAGLLQAQLA
jgi:hypothetical protein